MIELGYFDRMLANDKYIVLIPKNTPPIRPHIVIADKKSIYGKFDSESQTIMLNIDVNDIKIIEAKDIYTMSLEEILETHTETQEV